jgi:hypothetical protein
MMPIRKAKQRKSENFLIQVVNEAVYKSESKYSLVRPTKGLSNKPPKSRMSLNNNLITKCNCWTSPSQTALTNWYAKNSARPVKGGNIFNLLLQVR